MNYRHAYHAGNFADVVKHVVLTLALEHLKLKPAPFRVIDTHAGVGVYDLSGEEARKTGEWRDGIGRLMAEQPPEALRPLLAPYLDVVRALNGGAGLRRYPGSPRLARALLRRGDQLVANELHPEDAALLQQLFAGDPQTKVLRLDAWIALKSLLPPKERRGLVLIDPPFEEEGEFARIAKGLREAVRRFATGTYLVWYPIKDPARAAFVLPGALQDRSGAPSAPRAFDPRAGQPRAAQRLRSRRAQSAVHARGKGGAAPSLSRPAAGPGRRRWLSARVGRACRRACESVAPIHDESMWCAAATGRRKRPCPRRYLWTGGWAAAAKAGRVDRSLPITRSIEERGSMLHIKRALTVSMAVAAVAFGAVTAAEAAPKGNCVVKAAEGTGSDEKAAKFQVDEALLQAVDWGAWAAWMANGSTPGWDFGKRTYKCSAGGIGIVCRGQAKLCKV